MKAVDILGAGFLTASPLGFGISLIAGLVLLKGRGRHLCLAALLSLGVGLALLMHSAIFHLPYTTRKTVEGAGGMFGFLALFLIYLRHTYFPTVLKWVNLPATLGLGASLLFGCALVLLAS